MIRVALTMLASLVLLVHGCMNEVQNTLGEDASATDIGKQDISSPLSDVTPHTDIQDTSSSAEVIDGGLAQPEDIDISVDVEPQERPLCQP